MMRDVHLAIGCQLYPQVLDYTGTSTATVKAYLVKFPQRYVAAPKLFAPTV